MKWNWLESKSKLIVSPTALESNQSLQICTRMYTFVLQACVPTAAHINNSFVTLNLFQFICSKWQIMRYNYISWIAAQGSRALMRAPIFNEILCYLCAFFQQTRLPVRPRVCVCVRNYHLPSSAATVRMSVVPLPTSQSASLRSVPLQLLHNLRRARNGSRA